MNVYISRALLAFIAAILCLNLLRPMQLWQPLALLLPFGGVCYLHYRRSAWQGMAMLALIWISFPLLKGIKQYWLPWQADALLARIDRLLWGGEILPAYFRYETQPFLADVLAFCYFSFFFLVLAAAYYFHRQAFYRHAFFNGLLGIYLCGLCGYFLLPAAGPAFTTLPDRGATGMIAPWLIEIVKNGVTGMDVFPSLHTALPLFITLFLWKNTPLKAVAVVLSLLTLGIIAATIFLRYHYGIDVIVGIVLALIWAKNSHIQIVKQKDSL